MRPRTIFWPCVLAMSLFALAKSKDTQTLLHTVLRDYPIDILFAGATSAGVGCLIRKRQHDYYTDSRQESAEKDGAIMAGMFVANYFLSPGPFFFVCFSTYMTGLVLCNEILYGLLCIKLKRQCAAFSKLGTPTQKLVFAHLPSFGDTHIRVKINEVVLCSRLFSLQEALECTDPYKETLGLPETQRALSVLLQNAGDYLEHRQQIMARQELYSGEHDLERKAQIEKSLLAYRETFVKKWGASLLPK